MSLHNILVDNNNTLYCSDLVVSDAITIAGAGVPTLINQVISIPYSYGGISLGNLSCVATRISTSNKPGYVYLTIPPFTYTPSTASAFTFDISSFAGFLIYENFIGNSYATVTNGSGGNTQLARIEIDGINQTIIMYGDIDSGSFASGYPAGIKYATTITYLQAFA